MSQDTLVLNGGNFQPLTVLGWKRSVTLIYQDKVYPVEEYEDWEVKSPSTEIQVPSVVSLFEYVPHERQIPFTRRNIYARDGFKCQYCGVDAKNPESEINISELTFDHVLPKSRDGKTSWNNIVTSCQSCNLQKGDNTPEEGDLSLLKEPEKPDLANPLLLELRGKDVPEEWEQYFSKNLSR
jgi:5-methylcytosine-specific restriction endonuclease McrA